MINMINVPFSKDSLKALLEIAKLLKCTYFYAINDGIKTSTFGLGPDMAIIKRIELINNHIINLAPYYPLALMEKDLATLVKNMEENILDKALVTYAIGYDEYFPKYICISDNENNTLVENCISFDNGKRIINSILNELNYYNEPFISLENNEQFNSILETKAKDGLSYFNISNQTIQVMPSILGANKGDKISVRITPINTINNSEIVEFKVDKKSKHCSIFISYRIIPLIR